jgi:hypothetical protein
MISILSQFPSVYPRINFWMPEAILMKSGTYEYIISTAYFINPSYQSVCICIPLSLLGNSSTKNVIAAKNIKQQ